MAKHKTPDRHGIKQKTTFAKHYHQNLDIYGNEIRDSHSECHHSGPNVFTACKLSTTEPAVMMYNMDDGFVRQIINDDK